MVTPPTSDRRRNEERPRATVFRCEIDGTEFTSRDECVTYIQSEFGTRERLEYLAESDKVDVDLSEGRIDAFRTLMDAFTADERAALLMDSEETVADNKEDLFGRTMTTVTMVVRGPGEVSLRTGETELIHDGNGSGTAGLAAEPDYYPGETQTTNNPHEPGHPLYEN